MSVGLEWQSVSKTAITKMVHTHVHAMLATSLLMMDSTVLVRY